jgi:protein-S-isoprenylcysteine O-methyltransferase Ste14
MNGAVLTLQLCSYLFMYALPRVFFRRKHGLRDFNLMWWVTAAPFGLAPLSMVLVALGRMPILTPGHAWLEIASVPVSVASLALLFMTLGTHRIPLSLWHQADDAPRSIVTDGAYARIRHPFYASFILMLIASAMAAPQVGTFAALVAGVTALSLTARREERRLLASEFGHTYAQYFKRTGRFMPRLGA